MRHADQGLAEVSGYFVSRVAVAFVVPDPEQNPLSEYVSSPVAVGAALTGSKVSVSEWVRVPFSVWLLQSLVEATESTQPSGASVAELVTPYETRTIPSLSRSMLTESIAGW